jgi:putative two-component system response regulator
VTVTDKQTILIIDDDQELAEMLQNLLRAQGYDVSHARDGLEAIDAVACSPPNLILLDLEMPRMDGFEVCRRIKCDPRTRLIPVIVLTGHNETELRPRIWDLGADEFLTKPCQTLEVLSRCRSLLRIKNLVDELESAESVVFALARTIEAKSTYTQGHSERVAKYALTLAARVGISTDEQAALQRGAALHDIGKIAIPDGILDKPGALTKEEYEIIKTHPMTGVHIVEPLHSIRDAVPLIRWHHERMNGQGYPDGLFAGAIPFLTRILAVADVFDALSSARSYRPAMPHSKCLATLKVSAASGELDPELVGIFCEHPAVQVVDCEQFEVRSPRYAENIDVNEYSGVFHDDIYGGRAN